MTQQERYFVERKSLMNTSRLIIRKFSEDDIDIIYEINNHPECIRFNGWDSMSKDECRIVLHNWMSKVLSLMCCARSYC